MSVTIALVQLDCSSTESVSERIARAHTFITEAAQRAQIVVLPELWHVGAFDMEAARAHAQSIDGPLVTGLAALAKKHGIWLHGGSFTEVTSAGEHFNTSVLFTPDGQLAASYRKIHLFGFTGGETTLMSGGEELVVIDTPLGPTGIATCYDLRFPELFRALIAGDASVFLMCSGWPTRRIAHWDVLTQARAIEDQAWVIACNQVGQQGSVTLGGHSIVVDPKGTVIAQAGEDETILYAEIDPQLADQWRQEFPALPDIRIA